MQHARTAWALSLIALLLPVRASGAAKPRPPRVSDTEVALNTREQEALGIATETLALGAIESPIATLGTVAFDDVRLVRVFSPVSGIVSKVIAPLGAQVGRDAPLAVLSSADMAGAKADLVRAQASLKHAREESSRQQLLFDQHAASARDFEAAKDNLRRAEAERDRAQQQVSLLTGGMRDVTEPTFTLRSPLMGEVVARNVGLGTQVRGQYQGGSAAPLFTIADLDTVWLQVELHEADIGRVRRGAQVWVHEGGPQIVSTKASVGEPVSLPPLVGTVDFVADIVDPNAHTMEVRCTVDNRDRRLRPGMRVMVDIAGSAERVLSVDANSIVYVGRQPYVFVCGEGRGDEALYRLHPIELGDDTPEGDDEDAQVAHGHFHEQAEGYIAVEERRRRAVAHGVREGDRVVSHGAKALLEKLARLLAGGSL